MRESARSNSAAFEALAEEKKVGLDINLRLKKKYVFPAQSLKSLKQEIRADADLLMKNLYDKVTQCCKGGS
ncbi:MAG: hypothetical protein K1W12_11850 [Turicimonas muris]